MDDRDDEVLDEELELFDQDGPDLFAAPDEPSILDLPEDVTPQREAPEVPVRRHTDDGEITESLVEVVAALRAPAATDRPEAPLALYRRYRPDIFADVIGQEHVTDPLQRALVNNRVNHAYLFSGPRGCGKTSSARILARALNCEQGPTPIPCGVCQSCRDLSRGGPGSIDVIEIDAASHGGVDDARDLRERAFFAPVHSRYKIYIVDEAHMVTTAGFNALLKVVEEPPPHVKFIFATTEPEKVIGTIRSRTHHYPFRLVPPKVLSTYLGRLCDAEGVSVDQSVLPLVVRAGAGSVRDSLSVLDQLLGGAAESGVTYAQAVGLLGYTPDALLDEIVDAFAAGDAHGVFAAVDKVIEVGQDPRRFAEDLLRRLRDLIIVAAVPDALSSGLVDVAADQADRLRAQASALGPGELARAAEVIATGLTEMRGTTAPRLHLELMCARVLLPGADVDARGVHARLDRLERRLGVEGAVGGRSSAPASDPTGEETAVIGGRRRAEAAEAERAAQQAERAGQPAERGAQQAERAGQQAVRSDAAPPWGVSDGPGRPSSGPTGAPAARPAGGDALSPQPRPAPAAKAATPVATTAGRSGDRPAERPGRGPAAPGSSLPPAADEPSWADEPPWEVPPPDEHPSHPATSAQRPASAGPGHRTVGAPTNGRAADGRPQTASSASAPEAPGVDRPAPAANRPAAPAGGPTAPANQHAAPAARPGAPASHPGPPSQPTPATRPSAGERSGTGLTTADFRRLWPDILTEVRDRRRYTWILLTQNAHVVDAMGGVLTLGLSNPGARDSFSKGGSEEVLRESILAVAGEAVRIDAIVAPTDGQAPAAASLAPQPPAPARPPEPPRAAAVEAKSNIRPTRTASSPESAATDEPEPSRDDANLDEGTGGHAELLAQQLGAELIAEE